MTTNTRRYVWLCAVLGILLAPVAIVTWPAILGTDVHAPRGWVSALSAQELDDAARYIDEYPPSYRRAIMRALTPEKRSDVWKGYIRNYVARHPNLGPEARRALQDVSAFFTPKFFAKEKSASC